MPTKLIDKLRRNTVWEETIKLYSGLLQEPERKSFILDLGQHDILLASECKSISIKEEKKIKTALIEEANRKLLDPNSHIDADGILSLIELKSFDSISKLLLKIETPSTEHKDAIDMVIGGIAPEKAIDIFNVLVDLDRMNQGIFLHWAIDSFKASFEEHGDKYSDEIVREILLLILSTMRIDLVLKVAELIGSYESDQLLSKKTKEFVNEVLKSVSINNRNVLQTLLDIVKKIKMDPKSFKEIFKECYCKKSKKAIVSHLLPKDINELLEEFKYSFFDLYDWADVPPKIVEKKNGSFK